MERHIIAISGKARCGKDTIANYLVRSHGYHKMSIAEPLKDVCKDIFGFNHDQLYGESKDFPDKFWGVTPRLCLQYIGTDLMRHQINNIIPGVDNNLWIICLCKKIMDNPEITKIVIPDIRFQNELDHLSKLGIPITSVGVFRQLEDNDSSKYKHESETQLIIPKLFINNSGTIEDLEYTIQETLFSDEMEIF